MYGGIEAGGTKFVCALGTGPDDVQAIACFETTSPEETLSEVIGFFQANPARGIGIGSFGPLDLNPSSVTFGYITSTPKPGWASVNLTGIVRDALSIPVTVDTDVNAAAWGERAWGAGRGLDNLVYLTVGTGIGGGAIINGEIVHGRTHPEMGHILVPHDREKDPFPGCCPYHGDCLEGLASGEAMRQRWGTPAPALPPEHPGWELEAGYLAAGIVNTILTLSPERVILGGGVASQPRLLPMVRARVAELLNSYADAPQITGDIEGYIVPPGLGDNSGVLGAIALAARAAR